MATSRVERLKSPINIGSISKTIRELVKSHKAPRVIPWPFIWDSGIPHKVILQTAGHCFKYQATYECSVTPAENAGVRIWRKQTERDFLNYLHQTPQSWDVYKSLRQAHMIIPIDVTESFSERGRRLLVSMTSGINRLLKGGI